MDIDNETTGVDWKGQTLSQSTEMPFKDQRTLWQRTRNKTTPFPARRAFVGLSFNAGSGWRSAEASVDLPEGVGVLRLEVKTLQDGKEIKFPDDVYLAADKGE